MNTNLNHQNQKHYGDKINFVLFFIVILTITVMCYSQDKPHLNDEAKYYYSASNGDAGNPMMTTVANLYTENPERQALLTQLRNARLSDDVIKTKEIQTRLNEMEGVQPANYVNNPSQTGIVETNQHFTAEEGDGITQISGSNYWAIATQTSNRSQHIFTAVSEFVPTAGDQIKIYVSYNRGVSWVLKGTFNGFASSVKCRTDELDIEPVIYGTDTLLFVVAGYNYNNNNFSLIARFNIGTGAVYAQPFNLSNIFTKNYNPRVTSDNTVFGNNAYVYVTVSNDTLVSANNHKLRQRLCVIQDPFTACTQIHKIVNPAGGGFYWYYPGAPDNTYFYQDVAYYSDTTDHIYSATIFPGYNNVYTAWSKNTGGTIAGSLIISETLPISRVRIAFNGGGSNSNGAIIYLRNFTSNPAGDVDVKCQNTTTGGKSLSSFIASYVEFTTDTATTCDVQAIKLANNKFKFAYGVIGYECYYRSNTSTTNYSPVLQVNNQPGIRVKAGYRIAPTDSCLSIWSKNDGTGMYSTYGCDNFTGITSNNNQIPSEYSLSQNYPNPFNPVTNIKFSVPQVSFVKLIVYDITGREVASLVNQQMNAGVYTVDFNASNLSSGVYFYRINTEGFSDVKKMMLVK
ncbi:MAG TPA: T9SS type A sorting domain-containing protein [Ignavibacteria bacterium]|jgi:hypothetical protein